MHKCAAEDDGPRPGRTTKARSHFRAAYCRLTAKVPSWGRYLEEGNIESEAGSVVSVEQAPRGLVRANYVQLALPNTSPAAAEALNIGLVELSEREADRFCTKPK